MHLQNALRSFKIVHLKFAHCTHSQIMSNTIKVVVSGSLSVHLKHVMAKHDANMRHAVVSVYREMQISSSMDCLGRFQAGSVEEYIIHFITELPQ